MISSGWDGTPVWDPSPGLPLNEIEIILITVGFPCWIEDEFTTRSVSGLRYNGPLNRHHVLRAFQTPPFSSAVKCQPHAPLDYLISAVLMQ